MTYARPDLTVDIVLLTLMDGRLHVALAPREKEPFKGQWAVTGGYIHVNEDADSLAAALRTLAAKLDFVPRHLEQVFTEANATRDPRGWSASIVHLALHDRETLADLVARRGLQLFDAEENGEHLPKDMAFDHKELVRKAVERLRSKAGYSTIVGHFLPESFTLAELQSTYEAVLDTIIHPANFRQKILKHDVLEPTVMLHSSGRPAQGYRLVRDLDYFDKQLA
jgi:ADP-ribose pyrophosphatase YjhB (NUDIX family)